MYTDMAGEPFWARLLLAVVLSPLFAGLAIILIAAIDMFSAFAAGFIFNYLPFIRTLDWDEKRKKDWPELTVGEERKGCIVTLVIGAIIGLMFYAW